MNTGDPEADLYRTKRRVPKIQSKLLDKLPHAPMRVNQSCAPDSATLTPW